MRAEISTIAIGLMVGAALAGGGAVIYYAATAETRANEERWAGVIADAERAHGIPADLLHRLLQQESHFRTDIITGATRSSTGAAGIAQFMPGTAQEMGIDPLDPAQAIPAAALYLARLYHQFGTWSLAVMAYNWGPGNVAAYTHTGRGAHGQDVPAETVAYVSDITTATGVA